MVSCLIYSQDTINSIQLKNKLNHLNSTSEKLILLDTSLKNSIVIIDSLSANLILDYRATAIKSQKWNSALLYTNKLTDYYIFKSLEPQKAYNLCKKLHTNLRYCTNKKEIARFYINYAESATYLQKFKNSLSILNQGILELEKEKDSSLYEFGYAYLKAGENSTKINSISESAAYFKKASEIFTFQKDTLFYLWTQNGLSTLFSNNGLYDEAKKARQPIYKLGHLINEKQVVAMAHLRAAIDASINNDQQKELQHIKWALENMDSNSDVSEIVDILILSSAVGTYARQNDIKRSNYYLKELNTKINNTTNSAFLNSYYTLARAYNANANGNYNQAENYVVSIISSIKKSQEASNLLQLENLLALINENKGQTQKALSHYKRFVYIKDSINKAASKKQFAYVQSLFESEKKDLEIFRQQKNIELLSTENKIKNQWMLFGGISALVLLVIVYLWRSKMFIKRKEALQKQFSQNLIQRVEQERKRISRELHDGIGQNLLLIKNQFPIVSKKNDLTLIDDTINDVRNLSHNLHPFRFEKLGLIASLKYMIETFQQNSKIFYSETIEPPKKSISKNKEIYIYRMVQECLNNVEKHSNAKACKVSLLEQESNLIFEIKDNGVGFNISEKRNSIDSLGMKTLKERAKLIGATLNIQSETNKGTTIRIHVPK